jgi:hypothetical protein
MVRSLDEPLVPTHEDREEDRVLNEFAGDFFVPEELS